MTFQQTSSSIQPTIEQQQTYQEQLDERIAAKCVAEAEERSIPLWMLQGFPARSSEPDQDDLIDFL